MSIEELELELIDAGLEEIEEEDGVVLVTADYKDFGTLNKAFEDMGIELTKAKLERISNNPQEFTEEQQEDIGKLLEKIEDDDDVQAVYTNIA
jgi:transcriptional/translational regulatory protein YebC/TACO1